MELKQNLLQNYFNSKAKLLPLVNQQNDYISFSTQILLLLLYYPLEYLEQTII